MKNRTIKTSWEKKQKQRMRRKAVQELAREAKKADAEAKEVWTASSILHEYI